MLYYHFMIFFKENRSSGFGYISRQKKFKFSFTNTQHQYDWLPNFLLAYNLKHRPKQNCKNSVKSIQAFIVYDKLCDYHFYKKASNIGLNFLHLKAPQQGIFSDKLISILNMDKKLNEFWDYPFWNECSLKICTSFKLKN